MGLMGRCFAFLNRPFVRSSYSALLGQGIHALGAPDKNPKTQTFISNPEDSRVRSDAPSSQVIRLMLAT